MTCFNGVVAYASYWETPGPTCSVSFDTNPIEAGGGTYIRWSTSQATRLYINNIGWVSTQGGATYIAPGSTTDYSATVYDARNQVNYCGGALTVHRSCALPWGGTIAHGGTVTAYQEGSVALGSSCVSETRTCSDGTLSGSYNHPSCSVRTGADCSFNGAVVPHGTSVTAYETSGVAYGNSCVSQSRSCVNGTLSGTYAHTSCTVASPADCSYNGVTVPHGTSRMFYTSQTAPVGQMCSAIGQSRSCVNGALSGDGVYQYGSCVCAQVYSCTAGGDVQITSASCENSTIDVCSPIEMCVEGQSACVPRIITFVPFTGIRENGVTFSASGHLQAQPSLVRPGDTTRLYWNVIHAAGCTVTGSNGDVWNVLSTAVRGTTTSAITSRTTYTLTCSALPGVTPASITETAAVTITPTFSDQ